jgi:hypothetical protein
MHSAKYSLARGWLSEARLRFEFAEAQGQPG